MFLLFIIHFNVEWYGTAQTLKQINRTQTIPASNVPITKKVNSATLRVIAVELCIHDDLSVTLGSERSLALLHRRHSLKPPGWRC